MRAQSMHLLIRRIADNQCERGGLAAPISLVSVALHVPPFGMGWQGDSAGEPCQAEAVAFHITAVACPKGGSNIN